MDETDPLRVQRLSLGYDGQTISRELSLAIPENSFTVMAVLQQHLHQRRRATHHRTRRALQRTRAPDTLSHVGGSSTSTTVDLAGSLSRLAPPLVRLAAMHQAIRQRSRLATPIRSSVRSRTRVRDDTLAAATARYQAGATLREVAADLGVSRPYLASLLRARGVRLRRQPPSVDEVAEMKRRYAAGESLERVGTQLGFSAGTVRAWLLSEGVAMRDVHGRER